MQTIEITVTPDGQTTVETRGFSGTSCRQASEFIERALGQRTGEQLTSEFHQSQSAQQHQQERTG
jgi:hypothetical protein